MALGAAIRRAVLAARRACSSAAARTAVPHRDGHVLAEHAMAAGAAAGGGSGGRTWTAALPPAGLLSFDGINPAAKRCNKIAQRE